ncbi:hypothetical protein, partial [Desulfatirhabdium butyrativorans]|uniref:hypothetical protein n=1 Tax=Desulfatirhabdium butyrativorans TaxID=340467 RepID=UPI001B7FD1D8
LLTQTGFHFCTANFFFCCFENAFIYFSVSMAMAHPIFCIAFGIATECFCSAIIGVDSFS